MKRVKLNDAEALYSIGLYYHEENGPPQDWAKALELWHQAAELDNAESYYNIGCAYQQGNGVERDEKKAVYYWERAAMKGHTAARNNLGVLEHMEGNMERAIKHYMIAAEGGHNDSLTVIQKLLYSHGHVTKDEFTKALQVYQKYLSEVKSIQRDQAAAANAFYKYIE